MKTEILDATEENLERIIALLREKKAGVLPCDTIYGLSATVCPENEARLYEIKRRPASKSFIRLYDKDGLKNSGIAVPAEIFALWPAPFTAILEEGENSVAVRVPEDRYLMRILKETGPIFSTSVNFSGEKSLLSFEDILSVFDGKVDFIVRKEGLAGGQASSIFDCRTKPYKILRQGAFSLPF